MIRYIFSFKIEGTEESEEEQPSIVKGKHIDVDFLSNYVHKELFAFK